MVREEKIAENGALLPDMYSTADWDKTTRGELNIHDKMTIR